MRLWAGAVRLFARTTTCCVDKLVFCCGYCESCFDRTVRVAGPGYVLLGSVLIIGVCTVYFRVLLPLLFDLSSPRGVANSLTSVWLTFNILFNYWQCVRTRAGSPPDLFAEPDAERGAAPLSVGPPAGSLPPGARWCRKCSNMKPVLSHHCSVCDCCVLKMDHHCPWVNNCVGLRNYRYFFNFMFYLWSGCLYAAVVSSPAVSGDPELALLGRWMHRLAGGSEADWRLRSEQWRGRATAAGLQEDQLGAVTFSFILAFAVLIAISVLLGWHVYLVSTSQTTIEFYGNREARRAAAREGRGWVNEHDLGVRRNWQETFDERGSLWWIAFAMPRLAPHRGSGVVFATVASEERRKRGE